MTKAERRLQRAVRVTPRADRARYEAEWRGDLGAAREEGLDEGEVSRGALGMAWRLRARQFERALLGGSGPVRTVSAWVGVLVVVTLAVLFANVFLLAALVGAGVLIVVLARAGTPSHWSHALMILSAVTGVASAAFVWWVAGVRIDAADAMVPEPPLARWGGAALVVLALSILGFVVAAALAVARESSRTRQAAGRGPLS